jgi:dTDP-4-dehydrorhamnose reductase
MGLKPDSGPTTSAVFGAKARRPAYFVLAHEKLKQLGIDDLRLWPEALTAYLKEKGQKGGT